MIDLAAVAARADQIINGLAHYRHGRSAVVRWRVNYAEGRRAALGIHDSRVGSVYAPFQLREEVSGGFLLEWSDGRVSRGSLDGNSGRDLDSLLRAALETRYRDDEAAQFPGRCRIPTTPIYHPGIARIVAGRFAPLYDVIEVVVEQARAARVKKISGTARASVGASVVVTSEGLRYVALSSETAFSFGYDGELWDWRQSRKPFALATVRSVIDAAVPVLPHLRRSEKRFTGGRKLVLWMPRMAEELIDAYLVGNLYGSEVASGQSAFKIEDFHQHTRVVRRDLRLTVDPTVAWASGSYHLTSDGLPARREVYIGNGRLQRPIVGLKYAGRLKVRASTPPISMESVSLEAERTITAAQAMRRLSDGLVVLSALGLHTQDTGSGDFSLTAPRAIVVRGGEPGGAVKAVLAGNLFATLKADETEFVRVPGFRFPAILSYADVTIG